MHDAIKHTVGTTIAGGGFFGAITLEKVNQYGATACWIIGCIAGLCTIHSWYEKRKKRKAKEQSGK